MPRLIVDVEDPKSLAIAAMRLIELGCGFSVSFEGFVAEESPKKVAAALQNNYTAKKNRHATPVSETRVGKLIMEYMQNNTDLTAADFKDCLELSGFKPATASPTLSALYKEGLLTRKPNPEARGFIYNKKDD